MKLKDAITPFKVGLLVIFGAVAAVFMVSILQEGTGTGASGQTVLYAYFDDVTGLARRVRVQMSGIPVGEITDIELADNGMARVEFSIRDDLVLRRGVPPSERCQELLEERPQELDPKECWYRNGATVGKKSASFIGDFFLEVTPGTEGEELEDGARVYNVVTPMDIDQMLERMDQIASDVQQVTSSLAAVLGGPEGQKNIQEIVDSLQRILLTLQGFVDDNAGKVDRILANVEDISRDAQDLTETGSESINNILRDTEAVVQEVRYIVGQSSGDLQSGLGTLKGTLSRLQSTLDSLNYSLQNIQDITDKVNEGEGTLGELVNNPTIAQRTEQILEDAGEFVSRVSRLKTVIDLRSEYHINNQQLKNILGLRLQPSPEKYYLIELIDDYRGKTQVIRTTVNTTESGEDPIFTRTEIETTDAFKFSAQFARTFFLSPWFGITGRFGLIESSGGVGTNLLLLPDHDLQIQADLFDFGEDVNPRLRTFATWQFFSFAYIVGGLDDSLNPERREYFIGAGIRFDDEDLKAILTTTGVPSP